MQDHLVIWYEIPRKKMLRKIIYKILNAFE